MANVLTWAQAKKEAREIFKVYDITVVANERAEKVYLKKKEALQKKCPHKQLDWCGRCIACEKEFTTCEKCKCLIEKKGE